MKTYWMSWKHEPATPQTPIEKFRIYQVLLDGQAVRTDSFFLTKQGAQEACAKHNERQE